MASQEEPKSKKTDLRNKYSGILGVVKAKTLFPLFCDGANGFGKVSLPQMLGSEHRHACLRAG